MCNDEPIKEEFCLVCNSMSVQFCDDYPTMAMTKKCPFSFKPEGCFLFKGGEYNVSRGCLAEVDNSLEKPCRDNSQICKTCIGDSCNFKTDFQRCLVCDSSTDFKCSSSPWTTGGEICDDYLSECYTWVDRGITRRGCIGDEIMPKVKHCSNSSNCMKCSTNHCNGGPVMQENCVSCDSKIDPTCKTNSTFSSFENCPLMSTPMGCYHQIDSKTDAVKRGCVANLSDSEGKECNSNGSDCKKCMKKQCNSRKSFGKCFSCDSVQDLTCAFHPEILEKKVCRSYEDSCYTYISKSGVSRGCLNDNSLDIIRTCRTALYGKCEICANNETICNVNNVVLESCIECTSDEDENCRNEPEKANEVLCNLMNQSNHTGCYTNIVGKSIKRGCMNHLRGKDKPSCQQQSDSCKSCLGNNCNKKVKFQKCFDCNSRDDPHCTLVHNNASTKVSTCNQYWATCVSGIDENGYLHRRCSSNHTDDQVKLSNGFEACIDDQCNGLLFPENRLLCHQCIGNSSECSNLTDPHPCDVYSEYDQCYTYFDEG